MIDQILKLQNEAREALENDNIELAKNKVAEIKLIQETIKTTNELNSLDNNYQVKRNMENTCKVIETMCKSFIGKELSQEEKALLPGVEGLELPQEVLQIMQKRQATSIKMVVGELEADKTSGLVPYENFEDISELETMTDGEELNMADLSFKGIKFELKHKALLVAVSNAVMHFKGEELTNYLFDLYNRRLSITENKMAIEVLKSSKEVKLLTDINSLKDTIKTLEPNAKANAVIITNEDGYSKLDTVDENGNQLVTKENGEFIFDKKYKVITIDNVIFPSTESKAPFIIGDIASAIKFITNGGVNLATAEAGQCRGRMLRFIKLMDCVQISNSDKCYFVAEI